MIQKTQITIIGLGGVGGYFGFKLAETYKDHDAVQINFLVRGQTFEIVREHGLTLLSPEHETNTVKPHHIYQNIADLPEQDVFIFCTKEYDLENLCIQLKEKIRKDTVIIPLMNGMDIYDRIRNVISNGIILPSCVYVASHIKEKGVVEHKGIPGKIIIGKDPDHSAFNPEQLIELFKNAAIHIIYKADPFPEIWGKFFFIASFGLVSARYNKTIGEINEQPELHRIATLIMQELQSIAVKKGIDIPHDIIDQTFQKSQNFPYDTPTSLQLDVQSKKANTELELFGGAILNYGQELNIDVTHTNQIYKQIKASF